MQLCSFCVASSLCNYVQMRILPANMECITKEANTHKGSNGNPHRLEHGNKHRSFLIYAPSQYRKCHHTSESSLQNCFSHGNELFNKPSIIYNLFVYMLSFCFGCQYVLTEQIMEMSSMSGLRFQAFESLTTIRESIAHWMVPNRQQNATMVN